MYDQVKSNLAKDKSLTNFRDAAILVMKKCQINKEFIHTFSSKDR